MSHHKNSTESADRCNFCFGLIIFDHFLDLHVCIRCGAQETTRGWQVATPPSEQSGSGGKRLFDRLRFNAPAQIPLFS